MPDPRSIFPDQPLRTVPTSTATPTPAQTGPSLFPQEPDRLTDGMGRASQTPPDQAARVFNLQAKTGLPAEVITRNLDEVEKQAAAAGFDAAKFRKGSPLLASWLEQHPLHSALAGDDLVPLTALEHTVRFGANALRAVPAGFVKGANLGFFSILEAGGDVTGNYDLSKWAKDQNAWAQTTAQAIKGEQLGAGYYEKVAYSGFESIGTSLPILAVTLATKNPTLALSLMGTQTGGQAYSDARAAGIPATQAIAYATAQGMVEAWTESIGTKWLLKDLAANTGLFKTLLHQAVTEGFTEQIATGLQDLNDWATLHPDRPFSEYVAARPQAFVDTAIATTVSVAGQGGAAHTVNRIVTGLAAKRLTHDLGASVAETKMAKASPAKLQEFLDHATKDGPNEHLYVDPTSWVDYWRGQSEDPEQKAEDLGIPTSVYRTALETGADIAVPTAAYAVQIGPTSHNGFWENEIRLQPGEMNARETETFLAQQAELLKDGLPLTEPSPAQQMQQELSAHLVESAQMHPVEADTNAALLSTLFDSIERIGLNPREMLSRRFGGVTTETPSGNTPAAPPASEFQQGGVLTPEEQKALLDTPDALQALDRRISNLDEAPAGQVERRAPIASPTLEAGEIVDNRNIGATWRRMLAEDPTLRARAAAAQSNATRGKWVEGKPGTPFEGGGFWVLATGEQAFGATPEAAQQQLRALGFHVPAAQPVAAAKNPYTGTPTFWGYEPGPDGSPLAKFTVQTETGPTQIPASELQRYGMDVPDAPPPTGERLSGDELRRRARAAKGLPETLYQSAPETTGGAVNAPMFFSRIVLAVQNAKIEKGTAADWLAQINNAKTGANKDELAMTGLATFGGAPPQGTQREPMLFDLVDPDGVLTKQEVLNYLTQNKLEVVPVILGDNQAAGMAHYESYAVKGPSDLYEEHFLTFPVLPNPALAPGVLAKPREVKVAERRVPESGTFPGGGTVPGAFVQGGWIPYDPNAEVTIRPEQGSSGGFNVFVDGQKWLDAEGDPHYVWNPTREESLAQAQALWKAVGEAPAHEVVEDLPPAFTDAQVDEEVNRRAQEMINARVDDDAINQAVDDAVDKAMEDYEPPEMSASVVHDGDHWNATIESDNGEEEIGPDDGFATKADALAYAHEQISDRLDEAEQEAREDAGSGINVARIEENLREEAREDIDLDDLEEQVREGFRAHGSPAVGSHGGPLWRDGHETYDHVKNPAVRLRMDERVTSAGRTLFIHEIQPPKIEQRDRVPELLQKNWRPLAMKYAISLAVQRNMDAVAWATGKQSAAFYSLETQVKKIEWGQITDPYGSGKWWLTVTPKSGGGEIRVVLDDSPQHNVVTATRSEFIHKQLNAIIADEYIARMQEKPEGTLEGDGLTFGGAGLVRLYDKDLPNVANNLAVLKAAKVKASTVIVDTRDSESREQRTADAVDANEMGGGYNLRLSDGTRWGYWPNAADAERMRAQWNEKVLASAGKAASEQPAVIITPQLRQAILVGGVAMFQGAKLQENETYPTDIHGAAIAGPASAGRPGLGDANAAAALQRDDVQGVFATRTQLIQTGTRSLGATKVTSDKMAAAAFAYLGRGATERFDAIVTDKKGKPLAVVGSFKGTVDQTAVHIEVLTAEASRVKGAAAIWFGHNHPSGVANLSPDDRFIARKLADAFRDTAIKPMGVLAIGEGTYDHYDPEKGDASTRGPIPIIRKQMAVPVVEREFAATGKLSDEISSPEKAMALVPGMLSNQFGMVIADTKHHAIAVVPMQPGDAGELRAEGRLDALHRALSVAGGKTAIINVPDRQDLPAAMNLAAALQSLNVQTLDVISREGPDQAVRSLRLSGAHSMDFGTQFAQPHRASIRFDAETGRAKITLFATADRTSFIHEFGGHLYLEMVSDIVDELVKLDPTTLTTAQRRLVDDYHRILLPWLGVTSRAEIGVKEHEKWADGVEDYLMTNRAPSLELRPVFARVKAWMLGVYRTVKRNVLLTDEVRGFMDRLLASDDAIAAAEAQGQVTPIFTTAESAGMTPERFALYRKTIEAASTAAREKLDAQVLRDLAREQTALWKEQRQTIQDEVEAELHAQPVYKALAAIRKGTHPNGDPLIAGQDVAPLKLNRDQVVAAIGENATRTLPKPYVYTTDGGIDPALVAEMFGYPSATEMLQAIGTAPKLETVLQMRTDQRMLQEHGGLLTDGTLEEKADEALANDGREQVIRSEIRALQALKRTVGPHVRLAEKPLKAENKALAGQVQSMQRTAAHGPSTISNAIPSQVAINEAARQRISQTILRHLSPSLFWHAAQKANQTALAAAARQDFDTAISAHTQQLIALASYREASKVMADVQTRVEGARVLDSAASRKRLGKAGPTYQDQIDGILDRYEFAKVSDLAINRRAAMRKWAAALEGEGYPVELTDAQLDDSRRVNYRELTVAEITDVTDGLKHIVHLARLKNRLLSSADARSFSEQRDSLVASIRDKNDATPLPIEFRPADELKRKIGLAYASHRKIASLARALDGFVDGGPMQQMVMRRLNEAASAKQDRSQKTTIAYGKILEEHYPGRELRTLNDKLFIPAIGQSLSKEGRLAVGMNYGNEAGRERLLNDPTRRWSRAQVQAIIDTLDKRDLEFIKATWAFNDTFWPEIASQQQRITGLAPARVTPLGFDTKFGPVQGGYYHLAYDAKLSPRAQQHEAATMAKLGASAAYVRTTTRQGFVEARKQTVDLSLKLDLSVEYNHLDEVIHSLTHREMLSDVTRLLRDRQVQRAIYETRGDQVYQQFTGALEDIAVGNKPAHNFQDRAANFMRTGTQIAGLGWNFWTAAQQPLGLFNGMARVGPVWVAKGMTRWLRDAASMESTTKWIADVSPMMRHRVETSTQDIADLREKMKHAGGWFDNVVRKISADHLTQQAILDGYLWHIGLMQRVADVPTWLGAYEKAMAQGEHDEATAISIADQAVLDSQGGGQIKDLAKVQRGEPIFKLYMTFYSYGNTVFNANADAFEATNFKSPAQIATLLGHLSLINILPALGSVALAAAFGKAGSADDDWKDWLAKVGREALSGALNTMVFVREMTGLLSEGTRGYAGPAGARFLEMLYNLGGQAKQGTLDEGLWKAANSVAGVLFRYPSGQVQRTVDGWIALREGRTQNPMAVLTGPPPKKAQ